MKTKLFLTALTLVLLASCGSGNEPISAGEDPTTSTTEEILGAGPYPVADLEFTVTHPDGDPQVYRITCLGDTATVVGSELINDSDACGNLAKPEVKTRLVEGPPTDVACTEIYGGPDLAVVTGTFDGEVVNTTIDRVNGCGIADWDDLLEGILPPARGVTE